MPTPLVSIVIPTFNRARDLGRALRSVRAQHYQNWEALVVDNHSSDDTDRVIAEFQDSRIRTFKIHNDGVIAASRNLGIAHAEGEFVAFLDSDDWWTPEKLDESVRALEGGADLVYHDLYYATEQDQRKFYRHTHSRQLSPPADRDLIVNGNSIGTSSVMIRKVVLDRIDRLREDQELVTWEDYDAWIRVARLTDRLQFIDRRMGYCWRGGGNLLDSARVLSNIDAFDRHYGPAREWTFYTRGRCWYLLGNYSAAIGYFAQTLSKRVPLGIKLRAVVLIGLSALWRLRGSGAKKAVSNSPVK